MVERTGSSSFLGYAAPHGAQLTYVICQETKWSSLSVASFFTNTAFFATYRSHSRIPTTAMVLTQYNHYAATLTWTSRLLNSAHAGVDSPSAVFVSSPRCLQTPSTSPVSPGTVGFATYTVPRSSPCIPAARPLCCFIWKRGGIARPLTANSLDGAKFNNQTKHVISYQSYTGLIASLLGGKKQCPYYCGLPLSRLS